MERDTDRAVRLGAAAAEADGCLPLLDALGAESLRFPVPWQHLQPTGAGGLDGPALAALRDVLDALDGAGIRPAIVLQGAGLPEPLRAAGGWTDRATAEAFGSYAGALARALGDRVALWTTVDDPWSSAFAEHAGGAAFAAAHHLALAHGLAAAALRRELGDGAAVAVSLRLHVTLPEDEGDAAHLEAVRHRDLVNNHVFLGPMLDGSYPTDLIARTRHLTDWSFVRPGDLHVTRCRLDSLQLQPRDPAVARPGRQADGVHVLEPVSFDPVEVLSDVLRAVDGVFPGVPLSVLTSPASAADLDRTLAAVEEAAADGIDLREHLLVVDGLPPEVVDAHARAVAERRAARAAREVVEEPAATGLFRRLLRRRN